jgi:hypothetical protein
MIKFVQDFPNLSKFLDSASPLFSNVIGFFIFLSPHSVIGSPLPHPLLSGMGMLEAGP